MARMLGDAVRRNRQGSMWWKWCCPGHDGFWKDYVRTARGAQRNREKREWRREYGA